MPKYRRAFVPGGTFFLTLVTYNRTPLFANAENLSRLRSALATVKSEMPFEIQGAVIKPITCTSWTLPKQVGQAVPDSLGSPVVSEISRKSSR